MSKIKNENYITIQGWMVNELNLKGNELLVYATIYGFSQTDNQVFTGSLQYLADWTNSSRQGITKNLKSLIDKGYIKKTDKYVNGVKFCEYCTTKFNRVYNSVVQGVQPGCMEGVQQSCTNNIYNKKESKSTYAAIINELIKDEDIKEGIYEFIKMRKLMKKPMTDRALKQLIGKLNTLSANKQEQIQILDNSIINNWASVYPLKKETYSKNRRKEIVPEWMNKEIEEEHDPEKQKIMEEVEKEVLGLPVSEDLQDRVKALQERLKNN